MKNIFKRFLEFIDMDFQVFIFIVGIIGIGIFSVTYLSKGRDYIKAGHDYRMAYHEICFSVETNEVSGGIHEALGSSIENDEVSVEIYEALILFLERNEECRAVAKEAIKDGKITLGELSLIWAEHEKVLDKLEEARLDQAKEDLFKSLA